MRTKEYVKHAFYASVFLIKFYTNQIGFRWRWSV